MGLNESMLTSSSSNSGFTVLEQDDPNLVVILQS